MSNTIALIAHHAGALLNFRSDWIRNLCASGIRVLCLAPDYTEPERAAVRELGAEPFDYSLQRTGMNPLRDLYDMFALIRTLRQLKPDAVFAFSTKPVIYGTLAAWAPAPVVQAPLTFLLVARLLREKGILEYVAAAKEIKRQWPDKARFLLVGGLDTNPGGLTRTEVQSWVDDGTLEWPGHTDVRPWIQQASVFVLPSWREGVPRSTQEAMAMGRPIITTDAPGCRETIENGINGFRVPVRDIEALTQAMIQFIENPELVASMGAASRRLAEERFDVHQINHRLTNWVLNQPANPVPET